MTNPAFELAEIILDELTRLQNVALQAKRTLTYDEKRDGLAEWLQAHGVQAP